MPSGQFVSAAPFILIFALLVGLSLLELRIQDGSRIFLAGENLWDQGQKRAILCLLNYADSHTVEDMQCFRSEIDVVLGDMAARMELDADRTSYPAVTAGFERGRNRPEDIPLAITFYHLGRWNQEIGLAIRDWRSTDRDLLRLVAIADELEDRDRRTDSLSLKQEILAIDREVTLMERGFATHLNNGMRLLAVGLGLAECIAALISLSLAIFISRRLTQARETAQKQIQFMAFHDKLTGLPNRALLHERLKSAIAVADARDRKLAVLFLDLDRFKIINDSLGHSIGDLLLQQVAHRLKQYVRDEDTVGRVGGDEFLVALSSMEEADDAVHTAERILKAITEDFTGHGHIFNVSCSIGISIFPDHGADAETLIKNADAAMYCAKERGRNRLSVFADEMNAEITERMTIEKDLRLALERQELFLVYQPQINMTSARITGLEALIRWKHPERGMIPPDKFIRVAESSGLILPIGEWVLRTACTQACKWQDMGLPPVPVAVNVSAVQVRQEGFCELIKTVLRETRLAPRYLELELTESVLLSHEEVLFEVLRELKATGLSLAIDDFGTGYSSLSYLRQFPVSKLKIDRSFIRDVALDPDDAAITSAIISMARKLNLKVIAEGVETEEQVVFLREQRCDELQGYYFSRPLAPERLIERLAACMADPRGLAMTTSDDNQALIAATK